MSTEQFIAQMIILLADYNMLSRCTHLEQIYETTRLSLMVDSMGALKDDGKLNKMLDGVIKSRNGDS